MDQRGNVSNKGRKGDKDGENYFITVFVLGSVRPSACTFIRLFVLCSNLSAHSSAPLRFLVLPPNSSHSFFLLSFVLSAWAAVPCMPAFVFLLFLSSSSLWSLNEERKDEGEWKKGRKARRQEWINEWSEEEREEEKMDGGRKGGRVKQ